MNFADDSGRALSSGWLARDYGFTDVNGTQPPGYYPKEGVFTAQRGFELQAPGLPPLERLNIVELRKLALEVSIPGLDLAPTSEVLEALEGIDPERLEGKISGRFV